MRAWSWASVKPVSLLHLHSSFDMLYVVRSHLFAGPCRTGQQIVIIIMPQCRKLCELIPRDTDDFQGFEDFAGHTQCGVCWTYAM